MPDSCWIILGLLAIACTALAAPVTFFVAPDGDDGAAGTQAAPFATLDGARDAIRALKQTGPLPDGGVTVYLREGLHEVSRTFALDGRDSGTAETPVVYRAYEGEHPVVVGGRAITGWQVHEGKVLKADVAALGFEGIYFRQLLCNGKRMQLARYPNFDADNYVTGGWAYADGTYIPMYQSIPDEPQNLLHYKEADSREWGSPEEGEVMVFPRYNWWNNIIGIKSIDREARQIALVSDASYPIRPGDRYFVRNLREELDAPGEWYLDKADWTLYFWPPEDADPATMTVVAPVVRTIVQMRDGASHITLRGLTVECSEGTAIDINGTSDCLVAGCTIRNVGDYNGSGVSIGGGQRNGVAGCDIHDVGSNAIALYGGDQNTLEPAGNYADNNYIHHTGVFYKQGVGVALGGVGNRISHNLIHDCPRFGIAWGGNDHVFEFNEIRHCNLETADCGAIYSWQVDWCRRGTAIRYNYLHDIIGFGWENGKWASPHFNWGVYLDDGTCGVHVYGNIVARTILGGVHVHGGRDNLIENNILIDGRDSQVQYSGYVKGGHPVPMMTETWNKFHGTEAYLKYPGYEELTKSLEDAWEMAGNKFLRNIVSYHEPGAKLYAHYNLPTDKTESDYNLIWPGEQPIRTGITGIKGVIGENLVPNPSFEEGEPGELPPGWGLQVKPNDSRAVRDTEAAAEGESCLRIEGRGTWTDSSGQVLPINVVSDDIPLEPGKSYRLSAMVKAVGEEPVSFSIMPQAYVPGKFFWSRGKGGKATGEWTTVENVFRFPAPGDGDWKEGMESVKIRLDIAGGTGTMWMDAVDLREVEPLNEWEAWQELGLDRNSVVADPLFVDPAKDDYRLKPESPAFALGFKEIPVDQIGPYESDLRATWPIVEAVGAREQMTINWGRH